MGGVTGVQDTRGRYRAAGTESASVLIQRNPPAWGRGVPWRQFGLRLEVHTL